MISFAAVFVRLADMAPTTSGVYRMLFGSIALLALIGVQPRLHRGFADGWMGSALIAAFFTADMWFWHRSILYIGPGLSTLLANFQVFVLAAVGVFWFRERVGLRFAAAITLAAGGLWLLFGQEWGDLPPEYRAGVILGLLTALAYSGYILSLRGLQIRQPHTRVEARLAQVTILTGLMLGAINIAEGHGFAIPDTQSLLALIALGVVWQVLGGVHRGFSPLGGGAVENEDPETSDNYELGARYFGDAFFAEVIGFYSDFSNKAENCSVGSPCSNGATSGSFVTGEAEIAGVEFQLETGTRAGEFYVPVNFTYTYTQAEISKDNATSGLQKGEQLKDVPENQLSLRVGLEHQNGWDNYLVASYLDEMCVSAGCNNTATGLDETESLFVVDYISRYSLTPSADVFFKVDNLFDERRIVSRLPDGARPNLPRTASLGVSVNF